jgi:hypothetical protein
MIQSTAKLTIEHLAKHLPYGVKCIDGWNGVINTVKNGETMDYVLSSYKTEKPHKPILFPLSSLTEEITIKGETFFLALELIKKQLQRNQYNHSITEVTDIQFIDKVDYSEGLEWSEEEPCLWWKMSGYGYGIELGKCALYWVKEWLISNHFDIDGLIDQNLAIDANINNPY